MRFIKLLIVLILIYPGVCFAGWTETTISSYPYTQNFDDNSWVSTAALFYPTACNASTSHTTTGCYSGGCAFISPPYTACCDGINGCYSGLGLYRFPDTTRIHWRFLIKFEEDYFTSVSNAGGGLYIKFIDVGDESVTGERTGIFYLICTDSPSRYCAFGLYSTGGTVYYTNDANDYEIQYAAMKFSTTDYVNEWIAFEYYIDTAANQQGFYTWTQDGEFNGTHVGPRPAYYAGSVEQDNGYLTYYNAIVSNVADSDYLIDNLVISNSYIGPPDGFVGGSTPPTATGCTLSGASMQ
jgi:hypothetical protein